MSDATTTPVPEDAFWAKLSDERTGWHPLVAHSADVAAVVRSLLQPQSPLASRLADTIGLNRLPDSTCSALVYLTALHDMGKTNHGFQERRHPRAERRRFERQGHVKVVHESIGIGYGPLDDTIMHLLKPLGEDRETSYRLFQSALFHHGRPWGEAASTPRDPGRLWSRDSKTGRDPLGEIRRLASHSRRWSGIDALQEDLALPKDPAFTHLFAGIVMVADWIGSTETAFPFHPEAEKDPDAYWNEAMEKAVRACVCIGVLPEARVETPPGPDLYRCVFPTIFPENSPTPLQSRVADMSLPGAGSRILIESETGSGKTEAALALYARSRAAGRVGGLLFALPTRATATAMHDRIVKSLVGMYPEDGLPTVALAMGGTGLRAEAQEKFFDAARVQYDEGEAWRLATWSSSHAKKFFAAEIVVGTVDQVLLSGLVVDHAHLRLAALTRHLLVVDELHSYDRYMAEVLARVLDFHTFAGGVSLFMSATLSDVERRRYGGDYENAPSLSEAIRRDYPVISVRARGQTGWQDKALPVMGTESTLARRSKTVTWELATEAEGIEAALAGARAEARVCVLRNLVKDARSTVERIRRDGAGRLWRPPDSPHTPAYHSRYTPPDRSALDEAVLERFGPKAEEGDEKAEGGDEGVILVATQVVEQSLDVDFDLLITDLCPIDVLLQRVGRLHRHLKRNPHRPEGYGHPRLLVLGPQEGFAAMAAGKGYGPHGWGTVYRDLGDLELTRRLIANEGWSKIEIPENNRKLIERVYHAEPRERLRAESEAWEGNFIENEGRNLGQECHARNVTVDFGKDYARNADRWATHDGEGSIRTRLGDDRIRIELGHPVPAWYCKPDESVESVDLPVRVLGDDWDDKEPEIHDWTEHEDGAVSFVLGNAGRLRYDPDGWHWPKG